jgi:hypothetical protein
MSLMMYGIMRGVGAAAAAGGGEPDWNALLAKTGTGTPDATGFDPKTDITYLGAFRIPFLQNGVTNSREKRCLAFRPAEGSNGPNGSVFFGGQGGFSEHQIPALSTSLNHASLPAATVLQNWFNCRNSAPIAGTATADIGGWAKYIGGKLHLAYYVYYPGEYSTQQLLICNTPSNLSGSSYQGMIAISGADHVIRYCGEIPPAHRAAFGGRTHFAGVTTEVSIVARASFGHSVYSWSPGSIGPSDTTAPATQEVYFPQNNPHPWMSGSNEQVADHYGAQVGQSLDTYVDIPPANRLSDLSGLPQPDPSIRKHMITYGSACGLAFIPVGSNTIVFLGNTHGARYGDGYKEGTIEFGAGETTGFFPWSYYDYDNCFWTMNVIDAANAAPTNNMDYIEFGLFTTDPWLPLIEHRRGRIISGDYDPITGKLYVLQDGIPYSDYEDQHIVSVYQVTV